MHKTKSLIAASAAVCALSAARSSEVTPPRVRGILAVRADTPADKVAQIQAAWAEFKATAEADAKAKDALHAEKMAKLEDVLATTQKDLDALNLKMAAASGAGGVSSVDANAHREAFNTYFREGTGEHALGDLSVKAGLTTQSKPDGGYLVPTEMENTIDRVLGTVSVMRQLATVRPIGTSTYSKLVGQGGTTSGWVGEEDTRTETNTPNLRELEFTVMEIYAEPYATQTMLDDGRINIEQWLADEVQIEFAEKEGAAYVKGSGVKRPRGFTTYENVPNDSYSWGKIGYVKTGAADKFATSAPADVFVDAYYALKAGYRNAANWLISDGVMGAVRKMKDGQGNYLWAPPTGAGKPATILEKAVYTDDNMDPLGANKFPIAFGDFKRGYLILDRVGIRVLRNPYKVNGKVAFYTTKRVGGGVQNFEAIKLVKCEA
ncbi:phage major capsid protein [Asticcacaulis excentricus]|uniref:Phage major capsid protein, HK97 family n=1 Tax=Asticcacaulis excentricus (strain ATCC 15261 / DSM 4724 / KCTC 12464 / NCIMB 9791 / VKM B-1370 / CB 48) TaxID=573065 RepID=E8RPQ2_ASTEC|nr:phage major capsid protein [Asticcacaulis excentricus]ADU12029.1 phage major capsid protein, HK97 family [Asticcacaulis excentricus CB 48]